MAVTRSSKQNGLGGAQYFPDSTLSVTCLWSGLVPAVREPLVERLAQRAIRRLEWLTVQDSRFSTVAGVETYQVQGSLEGL